MRKLIVLLVIAVVIVSCNESYTPKPKGMIRIDLPEHAYQSFDSIYPFVFEYSKYAEVNHKELPEAQVNWFNIDYPDHKARLHMSYNPVEDNLLQLLEDSRSLAMKLIPKSNGIDDQLILDHDRNLYGIQYVISGSDAASPYQFFITDSVNHFLRGALYFSHAPNNDSVQPVIDFVYKDMQHFLDTFSWK
jgi:gliding motility-associated lipoprotein GldD